MKDPSERESEARDDLEECAELLERAAAQQREVLAEARREADERDLELVTEVLEREAARSDRPPFRRLWLVLFATAAAVLLWLRPWSPQGPDTLDRGPSGVVLNLDELELLRPVGEVESYSTIEWSSPIVAGVTFEVRVVGAEDPSEELFSDRVTGRTTTSAKLEEAATWPERIDVSLRATDADGNEIGSASASAWRSP